jgi:hypothetical protein
VCIFFAESQTPRLSANLTDVGGRHGCCCGAVSPNLRRELRAESSRRRCCSPWATPSPRAKTLALGEEGFTESWWFGSRRSFQLSVKTLFPVVVHGRNIYGKDGHENQLMKETWLGYGITPSVPEYKHS